MPNQADFLIIIPAYNERDALPGVLTEICRDLPGADVLVIDDGSSDGTALVAADHGVQTLVLPFNIGVGGAVRVGLMFGVRRGYGAVVQCDADGQHPAAAIPALLELLGEADLVIGARFGGEGDYRTRGPRKWAMTLLARVMSRLHRAHLTDVTSGFRAFGPRAMAVLSREMPPDYLGDTVEALVIAREYRLVVRQVPVAMRARQAGTASHHPVRAMLFLLRALLVLGLSLVRLLQPAQRKVAA